jgi:hypothetical protein
MAADPDRLRIMGVNTRRMAEAEFDRDKHFRMLEQTLEGALGGR